MIPEVKQERSSARHEPSTDIDLSPTTGKIPGGTCPRLVKKTRSKLSGSRYVHDIMPLDQRLCLMCGLSAFQSKSLRSDQTGQNVFQV